MKDRAGNELAIGDKVLYLEPNTSTSRLVWGTVDRFTQLMVIVKSQSNNESVRRHPASVVKPFKE